MGLLYFQASYGGVELMISTISTKSGRDIAVQSPARGDQHVLQDRGRKLLSSTATILFIDQPGKAPYLDRARNFDALAKGDGAQMFSHPLLGSYLARIEDYEHVLDDAARVTVTCTILAEDEPQVVFQASAGISSEAGLEAVADASTSVANALAAVGLSTGGALPTSPTLPSTSWSPLDALNAVASWVEGDSDLLDSQEVFADLATLTGQIDTAIDDLELTTDLARWPAYQQILRLRYELQRAAEAVTSDHDTLVEVTIVEPRPLRALCAEMYGGALAEDRAASVISINRVRTPGLIPAGTVLKMPATGARS